MSSVREVAKKAQVSTATVTRVLAGKTVVSPELTERVNQAVCDLHYTPNGVARSLARGRTNLLGLVVSDIANPFSAQVARGLEDEAVKHSYHVLVGSSDFQPEREGQLLTAFASRTVDAVALVSLSAASESLQLLSDTTLPLVFVDQLPRGDISAPVVRVDNFAAASAAVDHLIKLGHTDLAMISGPNEMSTATQRLLGFREACDSAGLEVREECIRINHLGVQGGYEATKEILALAQRPTALFSFNNLLATGALEAFQEANLKLPDDMSLITFDDMELFPYVNPPITAIAQPAYEIGVEAAKLLFALLAGEDVPLVVTLPTEFRVRASSGSPRVPVRDM